MFNLRLETICELSFIFHLTVIITNETVNHLQGIVCEDNLYDPQLDQGNEEVIRVALLTFDLIKVRANRLC